MRKRGATSVLEGGCRALLRTFAVLLLTAGLAALLALIVAGLSPQASGGAEWVQAIEAFARRVALTFVIASIAAFLLLRPARARRDPDGAESIHAGVKALLIALGAFTALQLPALVSWWTTAGDFPFQLPSGRSDPLGLGFVVRVLIHAAPALVALGAACFLIASFTALMGSGPSPGSMAAAVVLGCGFLLGAHLVLDGIRDAASLLSSVPAGDRDSTFEALAGWIARLDADGASLIHRFSWIAAGYFGATIVGYASSAARVTGRAEVAVGPQTTPIATGKDLQQANVSHAMSASGPFDQTSYVLRPTSVWPQVLFRWRMDQYDITSIPPSSRHRFSFSWARGTIRREPDGPDIARLEQRDRAIPITPRSYNLTELPSGARTAEFRRDAEGWSAMDSSGEPVLQVEGPRAIGSVRRYVAHTGSTEACHFDWALTGATVSSAELSIEFLAWDETALPRVVAFALGILLEEDARTAAQRALSSSS